MVGEWRNRKRYVGGLGVGWDYKGQELLGVEVKKGGKGRKVRTTLFKCFNLFASTQ